MKYDKDRIISDFNLTPFGTQGWMTNKSMECPFCGKSGKWGIIFNDTGIATYHCWKCPRKVSLYEFLKKLYHHAAFCGSEKPSKVFNI